MSAHELNDAQRRAVGVRLRYAGEILEELRGMAIVGETIDELASLVSHIRRETGAKSPPPPRYRARALAGELSLIAAEIGPRSLKGYGALTGTVEAYLASASERLRDLSYRLMDQIEALDTTPRTPRNQDR